VARMQPSSSRAGMTMERSFKGSVDVGGGEIMV